MSSSVFSFPLKPNQATLANFVAILDAPAISKEVIVPTLNLSGDGALALSAPTAVLSPYPRIPLMNSTNILSHKVPSA